MAVSRKNYYQAADRFREREDRKGALGDYSTGKADFDELMNPLNNARPKREDFVGVYGELEIKRDGQKVADIADSPAFQKERPEKATIVEAAIAYGIAKRGWLGQETEVRLTNDFDDYTRGTDIFVSMPHPDAIPGEKRRLNWSIDVTVSGNPDVLDKKVASSYQRLAEGPSVGNPDGKLTKLKYMPDPESGDPGRPGEQLHNHYVLSLSSTTADHLAKIFCKDKSNSAPLETVEFGAICQVLQSLKMEAMKEITFALNRHCVGRGQQYFFDAVKGKDKENPELVYDWAKNNFDKVEKDLKQAAKVDDEGVVELIDSVSDNLATVRYVDKAMAELISKNQKMADIVAKHLREAAKGIDRDPADGLVNIMDSGAYDLYKMPMSHINKLVDIFLNRLSRSKRFK